MRAIITLLFYATSVVSPTELSSVPPAGVFDGLHWLELDESHPPQNAGPRPLQGDAHLRNDSTIMVNIAAYRDGTRCGRSVYSFFTQAAHPDRVRVGVVQQNAPGDPDCVDSFCAILASEGAGRHGASTDAGSEAPTTATSLSGERLRGSSSSSGSDGPRAYSLGSNNTSFSSCRWSSQINVHRVSHLVARGPVRARAMGHKLRHQNDDADGARSFCLQTDSHVLVAPNWDCDAVHMWASTRNEFAVLTTYVPRLEELGVNLNQRWEVPVVCALSFREGIPRNAPATNAIHLTTPKLGTLWAAGFSFSKCHADVNVPTDPHLPQIFDGEEFSRGARLWTHGYDFYAPHRTVLAHNYSAHATLGWDGQLGWPRDPVELGESKQRIYSLLNMPGGSASVAAQLNRGGYGLGTRRTLKQYEQFVGTNLTQRRAAFSNIETLTGKVQKQQQAREQEQAEEHDDGAALLVRSDTRKTAPGSELIPGGARCGTVRYVQPEPLTKPGTSTLVKGSGKGSISSDDEDSSTDSSGRNNYSSRSDRNWDTKSTHYGDDNERVQGGSSISVEAGAAKTSPHLHASEWVPPNADGSDELSNSFVYFDSRAAAAAFFLGTVGCVAWAAYLVRWIGPLSEPSGHRRYHSEIDPRCVHGWA